MKKRIKVFVFGKYCHSANTDSALVKKYLKVNDLFTSSLKKADLILVNTCAFSKRTENISLNSIRYVQKRKKIGKNNTDRLLAMYK